MHVLEMAAGSGAADSGATIERAVMAALLIVSMWVATFVICKAVKSSNREAVAAFDLGEQLGRDRGYEEGRRVARPVVVPMPPACPCQGAGDLDRRGADARTKTSVG